MNAPKVEAEMNRDLQVVRDCTDYILREDLKWRHEHRGWCKTRKKYAIHASSRTLLEKEKRISVEEVKGFPVMFEVRESANHCSSDKNVHFGIFHPNVPESPEWPAEIPLLYWKDPRM